jgi:hypothetical protein
VPFPPGDTACASKRCPSRWREFAFVHHQIAQAIDPKLSLQSVIDDWKNIAGDLAESLRKRKTQECRFEED